HTSNSLKKRSKVAQLSVSSSGASAEKRSWFDVMSRSLSSWSGHLRHGGGLTVMKRFVRGHPDLRLVGIDERTSHVERFANADGDAMSGDELPARREALGVQELQPRPCPLDAVALLEQFRPRRSDAVKTQLCQSGRLPRLRGDPHRVDRLHLGDEARMEHDFADPPPD